MVRLLPSRFYYEKIEQRMRIYLLFPLCKAKMKYRRGACIDWESSPSGLESESSDD